MPEFPAPERRNVLQPGCARCPALVRSRRHISWGNGPVDAEGEADRQARPRSSGFDADVVVVGEAPAAGDPGADQWQGGNLTGMAYTSRHSGRRIRELFDALGYDPYYTNAVKCFPAAAEDADESGGTGWTSGASGAADAGAAGEAGGADPATATNREPTAAERRRCGVHLESEIRQVEPGVVVATGKHATASVLSLEDRELDGFLDAVLERMECPKLGVGLLPILHPSYEAVWRSRLGYSRKGYREAIAAELP